MGLLSFIKDVGEKLFGASAAQAATADELQKELAKHNLSAEGLTISVEGDKVTVTGKVASTEAAEKIQDLYLAGRKKEAATIRVREYLYRWSSWSITDENVKHEKRDANTIDFLVNIPADGEQKIRYSVRYTW